MKTAGIICEYNPFHLGHAGHIEKTKRIIGGDAAIVCVMSGNYVQRGDVAVFGKHARAKMAVQSGADLVIELQAPYALQSAEGFAGAGVYLLEKTGICDYLSFGSESGEIGLLRDAASAMATDQAQDLTREWLSKGVSYAAAQQKAAGFLLGKHAGIFDSPNNLLGIEYIKALAKYNSKLMPITVLRTGGDHDSDTGYSASALRKKIINGIIPRAAMTGAAASICSEEIDAGRGPVSVDSLEQAILSRLRLISDYTGIPGISEGLECRFKRYAAAGSSVESILEKIKTKRYLMSRLRRILMCAVLGIGDMYIKQPPPYIKVLAMNKTGMELLKETRKKAKLPVIIKPASVHKLDTFAVRLFEMEAMATDLYSLAYKNPDDKAGGQEWRLSPVIADQSR